ncbi:hypothetical protein C8R44DRAFT_767660 [Mycena epipterygia]|nr:hypothetical protein C8R44DRAFT_767660 [Mycena epipterygia]
MVDTLILWTIETTMITSFAGILELILFLTRKDLAWISFYLIQPKLFSNSMLASLNNRQRIRRQSGERYNVSSVHRQPHSSLNFQMHDWDITETNHGKPPEV